MKCIQGITAMKEMRERNQDKLLVHLFWAAWYKECDSLRKLF